MDKKQLLTQFSESILSHDVPLYTLKAILYLISKDQNEIDIDKLCSLMYINKRKLVNELTKLKPIDSIIQIDNSDEGFFQLIILDQFKIEFTEEQKKKKTKNDELKKKAKNQKESDILEVFEYWCLIMGKTSRTRLDTKRRRVISTALESLSVDECKLAIYGCSQSPWHMGHNPQNKEYNSLDLIFRDQDKIDGFIADAKGLSLEERVENEKNAKPITIENRMSDNDWIAERIDNFNKQKNQDNELIESKKETLKIEHQSLKIENKSYDVKGLVLASLKSMGFDEKIKTEDIAEFEVITQDNEVEEAVFDFVEEQNDKVEDSNDVPLYLKLAKEKK